MVQALGDEAPRSPSGMLWSVVGMRGTSLYWRVVSVNLAVLLLGLLLLLWTPVTVSAPVSVRQAIVLVAAVVVLAAADVVLVKLNFVGLAALVYQMQTLDVLRPRERLPQVGGSETRALIGGFNAMMDRLEAERRGSTRRAVATLEDERRRISRELHDEIGQRMTGILLQLGALCDEASDRTCPGIAAVQNEVRMVMDEIGALAWRIRPAILDHLGVLSALTALTDSLRGHGGPRIDSVLPARLPPMGAEVELAIYRVAQEALTNAVRHAGASNVRVGMELSETDLVLEVADDGHSVAGSVADGFGLRGMRERALLIGGVLRVQANAPHGLRIELAIPTGRLGG